MRHNIAAAGVSLSIMSIDTQIDPVKYQPYTDEIIRLRIKECPKLASLESINRALGELLSSENHDAPQIANIIRRDPSLSARLLRMVNSVYFGLATQVNSIEEAVFFLGLRQIRELATATPVIEEMQRFQNKETASLAWKDLWKHSIGTALLTREILSNTQMAGDDDTHYLVGLLHNVGKVVMASSFAEELQYLSTVPADNILHCAELEQQVIGWDHARIGAHYLRRHSLADEISDAIEYHNEPERAPENQNYAAAVQIADHLVRYSGVSNGFEQVPPIEVDSWLELPGWKILYGTSESNAARAQASLAQTLQRLPVMLNNLL